MPDNTKYWRNAVISIDVTRYWLTADEEYEVTDVGWTELEAQLKAALGIMTDGKDLKATFTEWQGPPKKGPDASP